MIPLSNLLRNLNGSNKLEGRVTERAYRGRVRSGHASLFISAGQKVQIYADPGSVVSVTVFRSKNTPYGCSWNNIVGGKYDYDEYMFFSFSGYLIDAP